MSLSCDVLVTEEGDDILFHGGDPRLTRVVGDDQNKNKKNFGGGGETKYHISSDSLCPHSSFVLSSTTASPIYTYQSAQIKNTLKKKALLHALHNDEDMLAEEVRLDVTKWLFCHDLSRLCQVITCASGTDAQLTLSCLQRCFHHHHHDVTVVVVGLDETGSGTELSVVGKNPLSGRTSGGGTRVVEKGHVVTHTAKCQCGAGGRRRRREGKKEEEENSMENSLCRSDYHVEMCGISLQNESSSSSPPCMMWDMRVIECVVGKVRGNEEEGNQCAKQYEQWRAKWDEKLNVLEMRKTPKRKGEENIGECCDWCEEYVGTESLSEQSDWNDVLSDVLPWNQTCEEDRSVVLHCMHGSKLGHCAPSLTCLLYLRRLFPHPYHTLSIVIDACQMRTTPARLRLFLEDPLNATVILTGSKYLAGPAFSGALLIPQCIASIMANLTPDQAAHAFLPSFRQSYAQRADFPLEWTTIRELFPSHKERFNWGQWFRWKLALLHMQQLREKTTKALRQRAVQSFARCVVETLKEECPSLTLLPPSITPKNPFVDQEFCERTVFAVRPDKACGLDATLLYNMLFDSAYGPSCLVGQPVALPSGAVIRLSCDARLVVQACEYFQSPHYKGDDQLWCRNLIQKVLFKTQWLLTHRPDLAAPHKSLSLDPSSVAEWNDFENFAMQYIHDMTSYVRGVRSRPVWQEPTEATRQFFKDFAHTNGGNTSWQQLLADMKQHVLPFPAGNLSPNFHGWVQGGGSMASVMADIFCSFLNANCGGRVQSALLMEKAVVDWVANQFGFNVDDASGVFCTGTSMANAMAVLVARTKALGPVVRREGLDHGLNLVAYASRAAHGCVSQAMQMSGFGTDRLRLVDTVSDTDHRMNTQHLRDLIQKDKAQGKTPFLVVATLGTVDMGAVDDVALIAQVIHDESPTTWLHIDGAFGAMCILSDKLNVHTNAISKVADSIALDFHKWGAATYDCGLLLCRSRDSQRQCFDSSFSSSSSVSYLRRDSQNRGMTSTMCDPWPVDLGPDLSRSLRAAKAYFAIRVYGREGLGSCIENSCRLASLLSHRMSQQPLWKVLNDPPTLNVVCMRYVGNSNAWSDDQVDSINESIVANVQMSGKAVVSAARVAGRFAIRVSFVNHRTLDSDVDWLIRTLQACVTQNV